LRKQEMILVLDFGGQNNQVLVKKIRELGVYSEILPYNASAEKIQAKMPGGVILSGESALEYQKNYPEIYELFRQMQIPVLSVSYGIPVVTYAVGDAVRQTEDGGKLLKDFLFNACQCQGSWSMDAFIEEQVALIKKQVGEKKVLCALSGGVDSSVAAILVHRAVGDQLTCVFVNHGFMRKGEPEQVQAVFREKYHIKLVYVDARQRFLEKVAGVTDPEQKRKIIGTEFIRVFEDEAAKLGQIDFLVQGTIYPDVIESETSSGATIKSHHNVGGLPKDLRFQLVEPLRELFKDEVRQVGRKLGLADEMVDRQPFPGPGLAVRVIGDITAEKLDILREADAIVREEIAKAGLQKQIWQSFAILPSVKTVGMKGEHRTYAYPIVLRAVNSQDAMTAEWVRLPYDLLDTISRRIVSEVPQVNRVVYDITSKPPGTIEWE
jgi:GMP synthase (glutamine-hydrolysing)